MTCDFCLLSNSFLGCLCFIRRHIASTIRKNFEVIFILRKSILQVFPFRHLGGQPPPHRAHLGVGEAHVHVVPRPSFEVTCDTALVSGSGQEGLAPRDVVETTSFRVHCPLQEERLRRGDDLRLQMALEESRRDTVKFPKKKEVSAPRAGRGGQVSV